MLISTTLASGILEIIQGCNAGIHVETRAGISGNSRNQAEDRNYKSNRYGDEFVVQLKGIVALGIEIVTRVHKWTLSYSQANGKVELNRSNLEFCQ
ncbi:hypothetical protein [Shewanella frigidimarina]|uniref:hypothetical protein n=1 Tax=Shewanella frigidimarina TaxID=56812 RepID=UPI003D79767F